MLLNDLCYEYLKNKNIENAIKILISLREKSEFELSSIFSNFFDKKFPNNFEIKSQYSICAYYNNEFEKSYEISNEILDNNILNENSSNYILFNQHFSIKHILDRYIFYNKEKIDQIINRPKKESPLVTFTITTCKRFDLFEKTINSIINCLDIDMIDYWYCIDDNSSDEDRIKMKTLYPFFNFYLKTFEEKGHPNSMNIIRNIVLENTKTPYIFHCEDDWKFFAKKNFIKNAIHVLENDPSIGQCLINKNYTETENDFNVKGGEFRITNKGFRYYVHEHANTQEKLDNWIKKHGAGLSSNYWPHFSFRPSLLRAKVYEDIGIFNKNINHFEREYAYRYIQKNYISVFFEGIYSIHTGRLTSQIHDENVANAYSLNKENQFENKKNITYNLDKIKTYVLNLDRRPDRWNIFEKNNSIQLDFLKYKRFSAVDGNKIKSTTQLQRIFNNNDYNMKSGCVGCLMSHVKMYIELINSEEYDIYCILEDDITLAPDFEKKFLHLFKQLTDKKWDLLYLGHHIRNKNESNLEFDKEKYPEIQKRNVIESFQKSVGGTTGYIITKTGAKKLLDFISLYGSTNCIDTLQQKSADILNVYYCVPQLIYSDCFVNNSNVDTDIQHNNKSLTVSFEKKVIDELDFYYRKGLVEKNFDDAINEINHNNSEYMIFCNSTTDNIQKICELCISKNINYYTIENRVIFIINKKNIDRYFHAFKINNKYSIDDCCLE